MKLLYLILFLCSLQAVPLFAQADAARQPLKTGTSTNAIDSLNHIAWQQKDFSPDSALLLAQQTILIAQELKYIRGEADALHTLGLIYWLQSDLPKALGYFLEAMHLREGIHDTMGLGRSYNNIGNIHFDQADYEAALSYYQKGLAIRETLQDTAGLIYSISNIADVFVEQENIAGAKANYEKGEALARLSKNNNALSHIEGRLAKLALLEGHYQQALAYWESAYAYAEMSQHKRQMVVCLQEIITLAILNESLDANKHESFAQQSSYLARDIGALDLQANAVLLLIEIAAVKGDLKASYYYHKQYQQLTKAILDQSKRKAIAAVQENYLAEKQAQEHLLAEQMNSKELSRRNDSLWFCLLLGAILFLLVFLVNYKRSYLKKEAIAQELEQKNKELASKNSDLEKFARVSAHDLKEPLRNIGAFSNLLQRRYHDQLDEDGQAYLAYILNGAQQMNSLLDDLQTYAKLTNEPNRAAIPVDLQQLVGGLFVDYQDKIITNQIVVELDRQLPQVQGHPDLLREVFQQLLDNAIKFNAPPKLTITIGYRPIADKHLFWIKDNGIGIEAQYHQQVFEVFQRLDKQNYGGTGVGLAICKKIIDHHEGRIWVESDLNKGSCFFFTLARHETDIVPKHQAPLNNTSEKSLSLLLANHLLPYTDFL